MSHGCEPCGAGLRSSGGLSTTCESCSGVLSCLGANDYGGDEGDGDGLGDGIVSLALPFETNGTELQQRHKVFVRVHARSLASMVPTDEGAWAGAGDGAGATEENWVESTAELESGLGRR